jgi:hypothetical protein
MGGVTYDTGAPCTVWFEISAANSVSVRYSGANGEPNLRPAAVPRRSSGSYFIAAEHDGKTRSQVLQLALDRLLL